MRQEPSRKPRPLPPHGTTARYGNSHRCRCEDCRLAGVRAAKRRRYNTDRGRPATVPTTEVARHLEALRALGWSWNQIAVAAGVHEETVTFAGGREQMRAGTAAAILSVHPRPAKTISVDGNGARLRLRALACLGWTWTQIGAHPAMAMSQPGVSRIATGERYRLSHTTLGRIQAVYADLWNKPAPAGRGASIARNRAAREGWLPPMALDDDRLDDPTYVPDVSHVVQPARRGSFDLDDVAELAGQGLTLPQVLDRLGVRTKGAVEHACRRGGRPELLEQLAVNARRAELGRWVA